MKKLWFLQHKLAVIGLAAALMAPLAPSAGAAQCLSPGEARAAVSSGQARALGSLSISGKIVDAKLCRQGGRLVYVLSVLQNGKVRTVTVDAKTGR